MCCLYSSIWDWICECLWFVWEHTHPELFKAEGDAGLTTDGKMIKLLRAQTQLSHHCPWWVWERRENAVWLDSFHAYQQNIDWHGWYLHRPPRGSWATHDHCSQTDSPPPETEGNAELCPPLTYSGQQKMIKQTLNGNANGSTLH